MINKDAQIVYKPATQDDPRKRRPDISRAAKQLNWSPRTDVVSGIKKTIQYFKEELGFADPAKDAACPVIWMPDGIVDRITGTQAVPQAAGTANAAK